MITRIYRVKIKAGTRAAFEPLFQTVARQSVESCAGCMRVVVGMPTPQSADEYAMISDWSDPAALTAFAGPDWSVAHIPDGMARFVDTCWGHHFEHTSKS